MAMAPEKINGLAVPRSRPKVWTKRFEDLCLCVALVVLLAWAVVVGLGAVNW